MEDGARSLVLCPLPPRSSRARRPNAIFRAAALVLFLTSFFSLPPLSPIHSPPPPPNPDPKKQMDELISTLNEFKTDYNQTHFVRNASFKAAADSIQGPARKIFIEFLERSCTAEFSGFLLYKELGRRLKKSNPAVAEVFTLMSRDEARHAGFLNKAMSDFNLALDLGFLTKNRKYTFFKVSGFFFLWSLRAKRAKRLFVVSFERAKRSEASEEAFYFSSSSERASERSEAKKLPLFFLSLFLSSSLSFFLPSFLPSFLSFFLSSRSLSHSSKRNKIHLFLSQHPNSPSTSSTRPFSPRRSATGATSRSTATCSATPTSSPTRSSSTLRTGARTRTATGTFSPRSSRPSRG